jgi:hypothetical protein
MKFSVAGTNRATALPPKPLPTQTAMNSMPSAPRSDEAPAPGGSADARPTAALLAEDRTLLNATIQAMHQGLMAIGPDQRVKLFKDQV